MKRILFLALLGLSLSMGMTSCMPSTTTAETAQQSSSGAKTMNVGKEFQIPTNAEGNTSEQQNILDRNKVCSDPTKVMWMHLIDFNGRIYLRTPVRGKITSSTKRLEPVTCAAQGYGGEYHYTLGAPVPGHNDLLTSEIIQIDGTYGSSDPYVYWFDPRGYYYQKGEGYILSDMPINTKAPIDEMTGLYNVDEHARQWADMQNPKKTTKDIEADTPKH